jgi:hypothetical protein
VNRQNGATEKENQGIQPESGGNEVPADFANPPDTTRKFESSVIPIMPTIKGKVVQPPLLESSRLKKQGRQVRKSINKSARQVSMELTEETVRRKTVSDTIQHPATMLPAAVCLISGIYFFSLSSFFGGAGVAIVIASISGVAAVVAYSVRYPKSFQINTRELTERFDIAREQLEQAQLNGLRKTLSAGFMSISSSEGLLVLDQLSSEYEQLKSALAQQRFTDALSVSVLPALAEETYRKGLGVLSDTLDLMNMVRTPGKEKLEKEMDQVEGEIKILENDRTQVDRLKFKEDVLASLEERLISVDRLKLWVDQLLHQARRCEATIHASRIELAKVRAGGTKSSLDSIIRVLEERIKQVKEVQDEINRLGY